MQNLVRVAELALSDIPGACRNAPIDASLIGHFFLNWHAQTIAHCNNSAWRIRNDLKADIGCLGQRVRSPCVRPAVWRGVHGKIGEKTRRYMPAGKENAIARTTSHGIHGVRVLARPRGPGARLGLFRPNERPATSQLRAFR
jgi:hypothetical protein